MCNVKICKRYLMHANRIMKGVNCLISVNCLVRYNNYLHPLFKCILSLLSEY